jgi:hypothetical protein
VKPLLTALIFVGFALLVGCGKPAPPPGDKPRTPDVSTTPGPAPASSTSMVASTEPPPVVLENMRQAPPLESEGKALPGLVAEFQNAKTTEDKLSALVDLDALDSPEAADRIAALALAESNPEVKGELVLSYAAFDLPIEIRRAFLAKILATSQHPEVREAVTEAVSRLDAEAAQKLR